MNEKIFVDNPIVELVERGGLIDLLLLDRTTEQNIIWASDDYARAPTEQIRAEDVRLITPRFMKAKLKQTRRTKARAEVFTPPNICREQNDLIDADWIDRIEREPLEYIDAQRLEITCGEAPYLVQRYNVVDGSPIELVGRNGLLDRKLKLVNKIARDRDDWFELARRAYRSIYGYEFQGDNLLIARCNVLLTADDFYRSKYKDVLPPDFLKELARIISWNIFQFDGLNEVIPFHSADKQGTLFGGEEPSAPCRIVDWQRRELAEFPSLKTIGAFKEDKDHV